VEKNMYICVCRFPSSILWEARTQTHGIDIFRNTESFSAASTFCRHLKHIEGNVHWVSAPDVATIWRLL